MNILTLLMSNDLLGVDFLFCFVLFLCYIQHNIRRMEIFYCTEFIVLIITCIFLSFFFFSAIITKNYYNWHLKLKHMTKYIDFSWALVPIFCILFSFHLLHPPGNFNSFYSYVLWKIRIHIIENERQEDSILELYCTLMNWINFRLP